MRYYATASGPRVRDAMRAGQLGMIATPASGNRIEDGVDWCADNGCYTPGSYPGDTEYLRWLTARRPFAARCAFATAPDVVADWTATLTRSVPMLPRIRAAGYPVALVAQDGATPATVPWADIDALFLGGTTGWKLGPTAALLAATARRRGLWVHMGRVNSRRRLGHATAIGCHSADGTYLAYGPDRNLPALLGWLSHTSQLAHGKTPAACPMAEADRGLRGQVSVPRPMAARRGDVPIPAQTTAIGCHSADGTYLAYGPDTVCPPSSAGSEPPCRTPPGKTT